MRIYSEFLPQCQVKAHIHRSGHGQLLTPTLAGEKSLEMALGLSADKPTCCPLAAQSYYTVIMNICIERFKQTGEN
jgi:hypothetical protein